jgi:hypothetical protein
MIEKMKQWLEALQNGIDGQTSIEMDEAITSLRQAIREHAMYEVQRLGQEIEQEPVAWRLESGQAVWFERTDPEANSALPNDVTAIPLYTQPQLEQNFCPRCGKRTNDIHTCTPPQEKNNA